MWIALRPTEVVYRERDLPSNLHFLKIMKMYCLSFCFYYKDKRGIVPIVLEQEHIVIE